MAVDFSAYMDIPMDTVEAPEAPPIGHWYGTVASWKTAEAAYEGPSGKKTPVVEISFKLGTPSDDVEMDGVKEGTGTGTLVRKSYDLPDSIYMIRKLAEDTCGLDVKGLSLNDTLDALKGAEVMLHIDHRIVDDGRVFPKLTKVLSANG